MKTLVKKIKNCEFNEGYDVEIHKNYPSNNMGKLPKCKHITDVRCVTNKGITGNEYKVYHYTIPEALISLNEGGYNSVLICINCLEDGI